MIFLNFKNPIYLLDSLPHGHHYHGPRLDQIERLEFFVKFPFRTMADQQCPCYGKTNDWRCQLTKPLETPAPYVPAGTRPGWIDTRQPCATGYCGMPVGTCGTSSRRGAVPEKLIFVMEWFDREADLVKKYTLVYYDVDKTCEIVGGLKKNHGFSKSFDHIYDFFICV